MNATPMMDGAHQSTRTTSRPLRTIRAAAFAAVAIAVLMALPLPALAGSTPYLGSAASPVGHAAAHSPAAAKSPHASAALPPSIAQMLNLAKHDPSALRASLSLRPSGTFAVGSGSGASPGPALAAPHPAALSGNTYVGGTQCSLGSTVAAINGTNSTLLAGESTLYLEFNGTGGSFCNTGSSQSASLLKQGYLEMERSTDGGATWTPSWLPQNASWTTPSSPLNGSVIGQWIPITSLAQPPYASPSIAVGSSGTVLVATQFMPGCWLVGACTSTTSVGPAGVAVARSTDGGTSWSKTAVLEHQPYFQNITPTGACVGLISAGDYNDFMPYSPTVAINPSTNDAIAAWEQFQLAIVMTSTVCNLFVFGTVQVSTSADGGVTWSAPVNVSGNESYNPQIAVGPSPSYTDTLVWQSWLNATVDNTTGAFGANWAVTTSSNNGATWTTPVDTTSGPGSVALLSRAASAPDTFAVTNQPYPLLVAGRPSLAIDTGATSTHIGNEYIVWADNQTPGATDQGFARIGFQEHVAGGSGWSAISYLTPATRSTAYLEPSVAVAPDGTVWVTFYALSESSGDLTTWAVYSTNGGTTWSTLSQITTANSVLPVGLESIGDYMGLVGTTAGAFATWMDCRTASCTGAVNTTVMGDLVEPVALTSNITGVNLTVTTNGASQTVALPGGEAWSIGSTHTVSAPGWFPHNATTVSSFVNYTGAVNSTSFLATFDYTGGSSVSANYQYVPGAFIAGTFSPNTPQSHLTIDGAVVTLTPVNASTETFNYSVASGRTYYANATASNLYQPLLNHPVGVAAGQTSVLTINLQKTVGWLTGRVTPANSTLLLNGAPVAINVTNGVYNVTEPWGSYWLNATGYGVTNFSRFVTVSPGQSTSTSITLIGGWIKGTLAAVFPGVTVTVDGVPVNSFLPAATFNQSFLGGRHTVEATAPGYNTSWVNLTVKPARTSLVTITLTNQGTIVGQVTPVGALGVARLTVNNVSRPGTGGNEPITGATGDFAVNVTGEVNWTVSVTANGYKTLSQVVFVRPGKQTAPVIINLVAVVVKGNCTTNNTCPQNSTKAPSSGISPLLIGGILVVVVLVAAIAAVVLMRRRGGSGGGDSGSQDNQMGPETAEPSDTYGAPPSAPPPGAE